MRVDLRDPVVSEIYNLGMEEGKEIRTLEVLEIIDKENDALDFGTKAKGVALSIKENVLALQGSDKE